ncbi:flagellar biosynthesis protein FlhB [Tepidibacter formicigenes]|jgi:flagellar biosynthetic protein FlhB|uniref:Flagellar biosynthetic protein FlhB n=1 Tax=Tepidibacter formicigenes DSM 15518 TaxID=1123349 RepID=A0A1M6JAE1_9FIRM|nr:flagellar biosynthesis protein FlhB [Tepidibacter formicigenes]SHJ43666.1 flagellar biosynthetic protein FlhB [Tepidibacter formicigenes DSM 15518]
MNIYINLQLFAGDEKTEKPTPKKKQEARKKGQVLQSKEITSSVTLIFSLLILKYFGKHIVNNLYESILFFKDNFFDAEFENTLVGYRVFIYIFYFAIKGASIVVLINAIIAILSSRIQVGQLFTTETLKFKFERLNPIEGFKKLISLRAFFEFSKSSFKLLILTIISYSYVKKNISYLLKPMYLGKVQFSYALFDLSINLGIRLSVVLFILSIFDYLYQWHEHEKNLKMSKQEIKEEFKQSEGDPQIKSKIKEKQRQSAMKRMMQDIPKADVVITNPTHFAIAIRYDEMEYDAPYVIAKGKNLVALKIKEKAKENNIPIVENKPLARELYALVNIGDLIPPQLYEAIAEILAYVYSLKNGSK